MCEQSVEKLQGIVKNSAGAMVKSSLKKCGVGENSFTGAVAFSHKTASPGDLPAEGINTPASLTFSTSSDQI